MPIPEVVEAVARKLTGAAGCSSVDSALLKCALLRYGKASSELREEMLEWTLWLGNTSPPWAAYRAMRQGRLVALDKQPGVRPVGIGECWIRAVSKCVLKECGREGKAACGSTQLCAGLEAEPGVGPHLEPVEEALRTQFIPALFGGQGPISNELHLLIAQGIKQGGLAIRNPVREAERLHQTSTEATSLLVESLVPNSQLDNEAHLGCVRGAGNAGRKARIEDGKAVVEDISQRRGPKVRKRLERMMETGAWLTAIPDRMSGTELSPRNGMTTSLLGMAWSPEDYPKSVMDVEQDSRLSMVSTVRKHD
eukprot:CCRYP_003626-RA/>CCRYP_003626-RA protein AED:0.41 eAED:0.41 QI:0/0/0/0.66/0.5/0.33/3/0/308